MTEISFQNFYAGYIKRLKSSGKGDTDHRQEIPQSSLDAIMDLLILLQKILRIKNKKSPEYHNLVSKLPEDYKNDYHFLMQKGMVFMILSLFARRAKEGMDKLTKSHFEKKYCDQNNYHYWKRAKGEKTKNHK